MIEIDGSIREGGGQILRTASALAVVTQKPCRVFNIRVNRPKPGLMLQHLIGLEALIQLTSNGKLEGNFLGSQEIKFYPGRIERGQKLINLKIETAGSITLVLQSLVLPALFSLRPVKIIFNGGATDTFFSPTFDHFRYVFLKILEKMGGRIEINILRRGYYPEGGAKCEILIHHREINGKNLGPITLIKRGGLKKILAISGASEFLKEKKVAERQLTGVKEILGKLKLPLEEKIEYYQTQSPGSQICLVAEFENTAIGSDNLGKLGKRAEEVGREAALELLKEERSGACLDKYLADQILPYLALAQGQSQVRVSQITSHCWTNIWVIEKFLKGKFKIKNNLISWQPL